MIIKVKVNKIFLILRQHLVLKLINFFLLSILCKKITKNSFNKDVIFLNFKEKIKYYEAILLFELVIDSCQIIRT